MPDLPSPPEPERQQELATLASDRDRDRMVEQLSAACADGRLELGAFSERVEAALAARNLAELEELGKDLGQPVARPVAADLPRRTNWLVAVMSSTVQKVRWTLQPNTHALAVMGDCRLDLRGAEVLARVSEIRAVAVMGSIHVIVPEGIDVELSGFAIMGTKTLKGDDSRPLPGAPLIRVTALAVMGEVVVEYRSERERRSKGDLRLRRGAERLDTLAARRGLRLEARLARHERRLGRRSSSGGDEEEDD
ncbi:MAG: DUF1707 SHOCT-like domain-containing protein [Candidatus Dormibacteria bacterium]